MFEGLAPLYLWIKAFHLLAVVAWMAGLMYLPRLFVYHVDALGHEPSVQRFITMERRLMRGIMNPAMIAVWILGLLLWAIQWDSYATAGWMHVKLLFVVLMTGAHHFFSLERKKLERGAPPREAKTYKILNELPFVLLIVIVIMVIVKPF